MASSVDGYVAVYDGQPDKERHEQGFTHEDDWNHLKELIRRSDAVILGSKTLIGGGGALDVRKSDGSYPVWITLTNRGIPQDHPFWGQTDIPRWIVSSDERNDPPQPNFSSFYYGTREVTGFLKERMEEHGFQHVLLLGGGQINKLFYEAGAVDELILTVCPVLVARKEAVPIVSPSIPEVVKLNLKASETKGNLVFLRYEVIKSALQTL